MKIEEFSKAYNVGCPLFSDCAVMWRVVPDKVEENKELVFDLHELIYVRRGRMRIIIAGVEYELKEGCLADINGSMNLMSMLWASPAVEAYMLVCTEDFVHMVFESRPPFGTDYVEYVVKHPVLQMSGRIVDAMKMDFLSLMRSVEDVDNIFRPKLVSSKICNIYMEVANYFITHAVLSPKDHSASDRKLELFNKFLTLLSSNIHKEHSVEFYARKLCITPQYLRIVVKSISKRGVSEIINDVLASEIKKLLKEQDVSLKQIVIETGFSDQSVFTKFFKRATGMTPMQYRNSL